MRISIIREDNAVYVDGIVQIVDCSSLPQEIHAIQWFGDKGWIEYVHFDKPNVNIDSFEQYSEYVEKWNLINNESTPPVIENVVETVTISKRKKK